VSTGAIGLATGRWLARSPIAAPAKIAFDIDTESAPSAAPLHIALSPDGTRLEAIVSTPQGQVIWLRSFDDVTGRILQGTVGANHPFWSPDGRWLAFFASGKLNKIEVSGGPVQPLCDAPAGHGGSWNRDGLIVFAPSSTGPLFTVSATGGTPGAVTAMNTERGEIAHRHPKFLPDGRHFIFFVASDQAASRGLYLGTLGSTVTSRLVASDAMGIFAPPHHLLYIRGSTLMAQRFDPQRLMLTGDPVPVAPDVGTNTDNSVSGVTVSETGVLAYRVGGNVSNRFLRWVDRSGKVLGQVGNVGPHANVRLSPDGERLVETHFDESGSAGDLWVLDLLRGSNSRLTSDPAIDDTGVWSPDGRQIVFASARGTGRDLYLKDATGTGPEELLLKTDASKTPTDWSQDGKYLLYTDERNQGDVWVLPLSGDKKPIPLVQTPFSERDAHFSPDGQWMAYTSTETGRPEVYVQHFPPSGRKWPISTTGGRQPHWRRDGRELFYNGTGGAAGAIWAVDITATESGSFRAGVPRTLFDGGNLAQRSTYGSRFDVTADGQRFLLNLNSLTAGSPPVRVIVNWAAALKE
jgi:Tol biopolymer transport system component